MRKQPSKNLQVQYWLRTSGAFCIYLATCKFYENIDRVVDSNGQFLSRQTAEYPSELVEQFEYYLFSTHVKDVQWIRQHSKSDIFRQIRPCIQQLWVTDGMRTPTPIHNRENKK